jgi:hypothetical protein
MTRSQDATLQAAGLPFTRPDVSVSRSELLSNTVGARSDFSLEGKADKSAANAERAMAARVRRLTLEPGTEMVATSTQAQSTSMSSLQQADLPGGGVEELESQVRRRLGGRVRDLRVLVRHDGVILQGWALNYHAKQLAQHAAMELAAARILANEIEVRWPSNPPPAAELEMSAAALAG